MSQENSLPPAADTLNQVATRIEAWRNGPKKSNRIPEDIWQAAVKLSKQYSINQVAKTLRLGYSDLKKRVKSHPEKNMPAVKVQSTQFIEMGLEKPSSMQQCTIIMEDNNGARMQIHLNGKTDLDLYELTRAFWSQKS